METLLYITNLEKKNLIRKPKRLKISFSVTEKKNYFSVFSMKFFERRALGTFANTQCFNFELEKKEII